MSRLHWDAQLPCCADCLRAAPGPSRQAHLASRAWCVDARMAQPRRCCPWAVAADKQGKQSKGRRLFYLQPILLSCFTMPLQRTILTLRRRICTNGQPWYSALFIVIFFFFFQIGKRCLAALRRLMHPGVGHRRSVRSSFHRSANSHDHRQRHVSRNAGEPGGNPLSSQSIGGAPQGKPSWMMGHAVLRIVKWFHPHALPLLSHPSL